MRTINQIIAHCSDTYARMNIGVPEITVWHVDERHFDEVGYHVVIKRDGSVELGRALSKPGAHAYGHNRHSIGVCWIGGKADDGSPEDNRTPEQKIAMRAVMQTLKAMFPEAEIIGHRDVSNKACPCFDARAEYADL